MHRLIRLSSVEQGKILCILISKANFILSSFEHEKTFIISGLGSLLVALILLLVRLVGSCFPFMLWKHIVGVTVQENEPRQFYQPVHLVFMDRPC